MFCNCGEILWQCIFKDFLKFQFILIKFVASDRRKHRHERIAQSPEPREKEIIHIERSPEPEVLPAHKREEEDIHSPSANEEQSEESSESESERSPSERSEREHSEEGRSDVEPEAPRRNSTGQYSGLEIRGSPWVHSS